MNEKYDRHEPRYLNFENFKTNINQSPPFMNIFQIIRCSPFTCDISAPTSK